MEPMGEPPAPVRVVVVDDNEDVRMLLRARFAREPLIDLVGEAIDAGSALEVVLATSPDVVILDQTIPGGPGTDIAPQLLALGIAPQVVIFSAYIDDQVAAAAEELGLLVATKDLSSRINATVLDAARRRLDGAALDGDAAVDDHH